MLVLGATGLLGQAFLAEASKQGITARGAARRQADIALDITDPDALAATLEAERPDIIVNCAALVDVAACEADIGLAYRINAEPLITLAQWSRKTGAKLVHVSTDHYFAGNGPIPHNEDAPITVFNQYAATKLAGERFAALNAEALTLRTSIVGMRGWEKPSFAEWAIQAVLQDQEMTLFADAYTSSIDTGSFARAALTLARRGTSGVLNLAAREIYSKEAFIRAIADELGVELTKSSSGSVAALDPPRPKSLGLDVSRAAALLDHPLPDLPQVVRTLVDAYRSRK
nr:SDR family oxidoreductase [Novosphingopyxis sp. YJ-S2-01]